MRVLPRLGMGCSTLGNLYRPMTEGAAEQTVVAALSAGITYFDVAPFYGFGLAERRLGDALARTGTPAIVSTKVGRMLDPAPGSSRERDGFVDADPFLARFDYRYDAVLRSHESSRARLRLDRINILLAHDLGELTHGEAAASHLRAFLGGGYRAMRRLRDEGAVDAIGIGVNQIAVCEQVLDHVELDVILLAGRYTLLEQVAAQPLLDRCLKAGVAVVVGGPYNSGILAEGSGAAASHFDYAAAPAEVVARVARLEAVCLADGVPLTAAALQFPLRHPAVTTVLPGLAGPEQVDQTIAGLAHSIPHSCWRALAEAAGCGDIPA